MERSVSQLGTKDFFLRQAKTLRLSDERSSGEVLVAWVHSVENTFLQFFILPEVRRRIQNRRFEHFLFFFAAWSLTEGCFLLSKQPRLELSIAASSLKIVKQTTSEAVITRSDQNQSVGLKAILLPILFCSRNLHFPPLYILLYGTTDA